MATSEVVSSAIPLLDVGRGNHPLLVEIKEAIERVCLSGRFLHGPEVGELESAVREICDVEHAIGCASGSDALLLSMMAADIGPGDEVIMPSFTFFATASAVSRLGGRPVFADIDPRTFNIRPEEIERLITPKTKAIIPVHLFGQCADLPTICDLAKKNGLLLVEDAAQAIGAKCQGVPAGSWGDLGCISFYPTKNLGGFGDGGMLTTNDAALADRIRLLASHGMRPRYYHDLVGINSRLDSIQAAVLAIKIQHLESINRGRAENASLYNELLGSANVDSDIIRPQTAKGNDHVWNQYTIRIPNGRRDALRQFLADRQIGSEIYYPVPLHMQRCFRDLHGQSALPETETVANEVLSLPIFAELTQAEIETVAQTIVEFCKQQRAAA